MIRKEVKDQVIAEYATHEGDTGSPEVQIAILTAPHQRTHRASARCTSMTITAAAAC